MDTKTMPFNIYFRTFYVGILREGTMYFLICMFMIDCDTKYIFQSRHVSLIIRLDCHNLKLMIENDPDTRSSVEAKRPTR